MRRIWRSALLVIMGIGAFMAGCGGLFGQGGQVTHTVTPIDSSYVQFVTDCNTGVLVSPNTLIQPGPGCDGWDNNRYERPFNAEDQDEYFPDLDILQAELGKAAGWFFLRLEVFDLRENEDTPLGTYAIEMDLDQDRRGDALVLAQTPGQGGENSWSVAGVQVWEDSDQTVGNMVPLVGDHPFDEDGYDKLLFNEGVGSDDPDVAWSRFIPGERPVVEIAFKSSLINDDDVFLWWVWAQQSMDPTQMDYHDAVEHPDAGDAYESQTYFPTNEINLVDNTCAALWGAPTDDDPSLCVNDPYVPHPTPGSRTPTFTPPSKRTITSTTVGGSRTPTRTPKTPLATYTPTEPLGCVDGAGGPVTCTPTPSPTKPSLTPSSTSGTGGCEDDNGNFATCTPTPTDPGGCRSAPCTPTPTKTEPSSGPTPTPTPTDCLFGKNC